MTALPNRDDIAGNPSRATAKTAFGQMWDALNERFFGGGATAAEKAATRGAVEATRALQPIAAAVAGNALTITLNPTALEFRHPTLSNGTVNTRVVGAPITLTVSSGSTLGTVSGRLAALAVVAIDNAGTVELAVANLAGTVVLDEGALFSTTAEGGAGAADSANVLYSSTARSNVPMRVVGYIVATQAVAGTWATAPSVVQGAGGHLPWLQKSTQIQQSASVSLSGQSSVDFTGIPAWAKRIVLTFSDLSTSGTAGPSVQLGDAGGIETTGYAGTGFFVASSNSTGAVNPSAGFSFGTSAWAATIIATGTLTIEKMAGNLWVGVLLSGRQESPVFQGSVVGKTLSDVLTQVRLLAGGADTFDGGTAILSWE